MTPLGLREALHQQIDHLPAEVVRQIADFALFLIQRYQLGASYIGWSQDERQACALEQFFCEEDEVEEISHCPDDTQEIFRQ